MDTTGFFGKLPSHGDFVSRRLSRDFLDVWDAWLQRCIAESKATLGENWLNVYLTSPIWRFAMTPGACGDEAHVGVLTPSVDRVGRYFPLSIVASAPDSAPALSIANAAGDWFERAEALLLTVLEENAPDFDAFDKSVALMTLDKLAVDATIDVAVDTSGSAARSWRLSIPDGATLGAVACRLVDKIIADEVGPYSIWWTEGSETVAPSLLATQILPDPSQYVAMLSGNGIPQEWQQAELPESDPNGVATTSLEELINTPTSLSFTSATKTDTGKVRLENEDAVLDKCEQGLWLVADGMGGHASGKTASAAIVSAVDQLELPDDLDGRIQTVTRSLQAVNRELRNYAEHHPGSSGLGSTIAAFFVAGNTSAIVWVGDTRVYRKRGYQLEQLTRDHSERQELLDRGDIASILGPTNVVTRAVGGEEILQVSTVRQAVQPGDRFLLCSDGVYEEVPVHELATLLEEPDCQKACNAIIDRVNEGRAQDNATAAIVDAAAT